MYVCKSESTAKVVCTSIICAILYTSYELLQQPVVLRVSLPRCGNQVAFIRAIPREASQSHRNASNRVLIVRVVDAQAVARRVGKQRSTPLLSRREDDPLRQCPCMRPIKSSCSSKNSKNAPVPLNGAHCFVLPGTSAPPLRNRCRQTVGVRCTQTRKIP